MSYKNNLSAGGIIIDPWNNINDPEKYNILIIKQRLGNNWGLPKGHKEENENLEECALREIKEETGYDFKELEEGIDYLRIYFKDNAKNCILEKNIKRITFYMFVLLRKGNHIPKYKRDTNEIKEITWINVGRLRKLFFKCHPNFKCNRTLNYQTSRLLDKICYQSHKLLLKNHYIE